MNTHFAVYFKRAPMFGDSGRDGYVYSGQTPSKIERMLDGYKRAYKSKDGYGLVGYMGADSFLDAVNDAVKWEKTGFFPQSTT